MLDITEGEYKLVDGEGRELETRAYAACRGEGTRGVCYVWSGGVEGGVLGTTWKVLRTYLDTYLTGETSQQSEKVR